MIGWKASYLQPVGMQFVSTVKMGSPDLDSTQVSRTPSLTCIITGMDFTVDSSAIRYNKN